MKLIDKEIKIGLEFYKVKLGNKNHYYKCKVIDIYDEKIMYERKGRSKLNQKHKWFVNRNIVAYRSLFFENKLKLLQYYDRLDNLSEQVIIEIEASKRNTPEEWI